MSATSATTTTMTSTLPRSSRPPLAPPTGPLPALPIAKPRASTSDPPESPSRRQSAGGASSSHLPAATPKRTAIPSSRSVTPSGLPTPRPVKSSSTPSVPTLTTTVLPDLPLPAASSADSSASPASGLPAPTALPRTIRKPTSVGSFPLPPKSGARVTSLPPSPLSASTSSNEKDGGPASNGAAAPGSRRDSAKHRSVESGFKRKTRSSGYGLRSRASNSTLNGAIPSLLTGTDESNLVVSNESGRQSDGLLKWPSPPESRSSSVNGSYGAEINAGADESTAGDELGGSSARSRSQTSDARNSLSESNRNSLGKDVKGNVLVSVRVRPDAGGDGDANNVPDGEWMVDGRRSLISYKGREGGDYRYDNVFSPHDHNARVYDNAAKRLVRRVMEGYHGTVFAYGMTGTGKTFSMQGTATSPGVIPLAITDIFSYIRENPSREFLLRVSYLEIYNEKIYDLLSQSTPGQAQQTEEIKLREDSKRGVYATPLKEEIVQSPNQLLRVIARGDVARRTGSTQFNARSSRSHAVVQIVVESRERTPVSSGHLDPNNKDSRRLDKVMAGGVLVSTLSLIDLAGSEKAAENKERRTEGAHINKSLLTLGTVIGRLSGDDDKDDSKEGGATKSSEPAKEKALKHLPYRDSKLTRLLQPALSGNSLVSILCTIQLSSAGTSAAQSSSHTSETLNTLKFASRAKNNIVSHAKRNESNPTSGDPGSRALLDRYRLEIQELRAQLDQQNKPKDEVERTDEIEQDRVREIELERAEQTRHEEQMLEMQLARTALKERISHLNRLILSSKSLGVNSGRFSSASLPMNPARSSVQSLTDNFGRPVSVRSRDSLASTHRNSTDTLDMAAQQGNVEESSGALVSGGSVVVSSLPIVQTSQLVSDDGPTGADGDDGSGPAADEDDEGAEGDADGNASPVQQIRMLQADLADKNRYISTLEKRLLQARRTSNSRVSSHFASRVGAPEDGSLEAVVREKDREIDELRAKLDDQMRMVTALRSAARKREMMSNSDKRKSFATTTSDDTARPATSHGISGGSDTRSLRDSVPDLSTLPLYGRLSSSLAPRHTSLVSSNSDIGDTADSVPDLVSNPYTRHSSSRASNHRSSITNPNSNSNNPHFSTSSTFSHRSNPSSTSRSSSGIFSFNNKPPVSLSQVSASPNPLTPLTLLSPTHSSTTSRDSTTFAKDDALLPNGSTATTTAPSSAATSASGPAVTFNLRASASSRRKSVDEMTQLLDQMIQDKVESGTIGRMSYRGTFGASAAAPSGQLRELRLVTANANANAAAAAAAASANGTPMSARAGGESPVKEVE